MKKKINDFLLLFKEASLDGIEINSNLVYANLVCMNNDEEDIIDMFPEWIQRFYVKNGIEVQRSKENRKVCLFTGHNSLPNSKKIKIYIPLDKEHIYEGVNKLFDFLIDENISHYSKVLNTTRLDDITIRVDDYESANKIIDFVNSNEYLKEGLIEPNPFAVTKSNIAVSFDGYLSYNRVLSTYISNYINDRVSKGLYDGICIDDFINYSKLTYENVFNKGRGISNFLHDKKSSKMLNMSDNLVNYEIVTRIILLALENIDIDDLYSHISLFNSTTYRENTKNKIDLLIKKDDVISDEEYEAFDIAFMQMTNIYGISHTIKIMEGFIESGNYKLFTRSNNIRNNFINFSLTQSKVSKLLKEKKKSAISTSTIKTYNKYGEKQLFNALLNALDGDYNGFTNDDNSRAYLKEMVKKDEIMILLLRILEDNEIDANSSNEIIPLYIGMLSNKKIK